jgi:uncharacterized protein
MLQHTFIHIPGIGLATEQRLWESGILHWRDVANAPKRHQHLARYLETSQAALQQGDITHFRRLASVGESWRVFEHFRSRCAYFDIETTGLSRMDDDITVAGLYDGEGFRTFVHGRNLDALPQALSRYDVIVTFNGACFDLPFVRAKWPTCHLPPLHIDLRQAAGKLGLKGGLKWIERGLGMQRDTAIAAVDGLEAVRLWWAYRRGHRHALETLIEYNRADVCNLERLMERCYADLKGLRIPFSAL